MNLSQALAEIKAKQKEIEELRTKEAMAIQELTELEVKYFGLKEGQRLDIIGIVELIERVTKDKFEEATADQPETTDQPAQ